MVINMADVRFNNNSFEHVNVKTVRQTYYQEFNVRTSIKKEFLKNKSALLSLILLIIITISCILANLSPFDPNAIDAKSKLLDASSKHFFGTDEYGRDYFTRALYGGRVSLIVGFLTMIVSTILGTLIGVVSGYIGGKLDTFIMRTIDIFLALPTMLLMIVLNTFLRPGLGTLVAVLSLFSWAQPARLIRAETMSIKQRNYVVASNNLGATNSWIIMHHIIPNIRGTVIISSSMTVAKAIITESTLSFLGLGVQVPQASWGSMLQGAQKYILDKPILAIYPGILILLTVLSFNLIGDVFRVALEPKKRG